MAENETAPAAEEAVTQPSAEEVKAAAAEQRADDAEYAVCCAMKQLGLDRQAAEKHLRKLGKEKCEAVVAAGRAGQLDELREVLGEAKPHADGTHA